MRKNYTWGKGYTYTKVPKYLINFNFHLFRWWYIRLFKIGTVRRRTGAKLTRPEIWKVYEKFLTTKKG